MSSYIANTFKRRQDQAILNESNLDTSEREPLTSPVRVLIHEDVEASPQIAIRQVNPPLEMQMNPLRQG